MKFLLLFFVILSVQAPLSARYIQADPIGLDGGLNRFVYVDADPVNNIDPTGLVKGIRNLRDFEPLEGSGGGMTGGGGRSAFTSSSKGGPPRDPKTTDYLPLPDAVGPHTTLGTRSGRSGTYTQGATFDANGRFLGRTDVTNHGRRDHVSPHFHPALGPNSVDNPQICMP